MLYYPYQPEWEEPGVHRVLPADQELVWLTLDLATVTPAGGMVDLGSPTLETAAVILSGILLLATPDGDWVRVGKRFSVFSGAGATVYIPAGQNAPVKADSDRVEIALCRGPARGRRQAVTVIPPGEVEVIRRGQGLWQREVRNILTDHVGPEIGSLVVGETINDPGQWSGYPPHKHDTDRGEDENVFEEVYYYRTDPDDGFGVQIHYGGRGQKDQGYLVRDRDSFAIPSGYHPVVAQGGYRLYYLWFMAGEHGRRPRPYEDPRYRWVNRTP